MESARITNGDVVLAIDAFGNKRRRRALSGVVQGHDFSVVWLCPEEEWLLADEEGRQPDGTPWPAEDVAVDSTAG